MSQICQRSAHKIHDHAQRVVRFAAEAVAAPRLHHARQLGTAQLVVLERHPVGVLEGLTGLGLGRRHPEGDHVIVGLVLGWNHDQFDATLAPVAFGRDPGAGPQVVAGLQILVIGEVTVSLHQPEALERFGAERGADQTLGVGQRAPHPLAGAVVDQQAVGIVNLGAEVLERRGLVLAVVVHARQRRKPELADLVTHEQGDFDVDLGIDAGLQHEAIGAGGARRIEQRVDFQRGRARRWPHHPELGEGRKFLTRNQPGVDRQSTAR